MKKLIACVLLFLCFNVLAVPNLTFIKQELTDYYDSGRYLTEVNAVIDEAKANLLRQVQVNTQHKKLALVLDIDDTAISNYNDIKNGDFAADYNARFKFLQSGNQPALAPVLSLYQLAMENNIGVFFITGRPVTVKELTENMLKRDAYTTWAGIYFKTEEYKNFSSTEFKTAMRKKIAESGYEIIENVGDQYSDLKGGYSLSQYKLPNPFYYIP